MLLGPLESLLECGSHGQCPQPALSHGYSPDGGRSGPSLPDLALGEPGGCLLIVGPAPQAWGGLWALGSLCLT